MHDSNIVVLYACLMHVGFVDAGFTEARIGSTSQRDPANNKRGEVFETNGSSI